MSLTTSPIQWLAGCDGSEGATWNVLTGCMRKSPACGVPGAGSCYAERLNATRLRRLPMYEGLAEMTKLGPRWTGERRLIVDKLDAPLHARRPRRIFVNDLGDTFFEKHPFKDIAAVFAVMAAAWWHTFYVLTKRPEVAIEFFAWIERRAEQGKQLFPDDTREWRIRQLLQSTLAKLGVRMPVPRSRAERFDGGVSCHDGNHAPWPLLNVGVGCTTEDRHRFDERAPLLRQIPAVMRFISIEGQCGDLWDRVQCPACGNALSERAPCGVCAGARFVTRNAAGELVPDVGEASREPDLTGIDWAIQGGWSGPKAGPFRVDWARRMRDLCWRQRKAYFLKQMGANVRTDGVQGPGTRWPVGTKFEDIGGEWRARLCGADGKGDSHGGNPVEWPEDLRGCRAWPDMPIDRERRRLLSVLQASLAEESDR